MFVEVLSKNILFSPLKILNSQMMGILIWHAVGYVGGVFISCVHCIDGEYQDRLRSGVTGVHCEDY